MDTREAKPEGLRERKRRETLHRIADAGLNLFIQNGYEATTLEAIAAAARISPRTFFYYFKTKDEVLQFWHDDGFVEALRPTLHEESRDQTPLAAARSCLLRLVSRYENDRSILINRLFQSTAALRARKQAAYVEMEETLFRGLHELWPQPERRQALRTVAMVSIGAMRLAIQTWRDDGGRRPIVDYLRESFAMLEEQIIAS
jgi:AcrR family transcriptional regulator